MEEKKDLLLESLKSMRVTTKTEVEKPEGILFVTERGKNVPIVSRQRMLSIEGTAKTTAVMFLASRLICDSFSDNPKYNVTNEAKAKSVVIFNTKDKKADIKRQIEQILKGAQFGNMDSVLAIGRLFIYQFRPKHKEAAADNLMSWVDNINADVVIIDNIDDITNGSFREGRDLARRLSIAAEKRKTAIIVTTNRRDDAAEEFIIAADDNMKVLLSSDRKNIYLYHEGSRYQRTFEAIAVPVMFSDN